MTNREDYLILIFKNLLKIPACPELDFPHYRNILKYKHYNETKLIRFYLNKDDKTYEGHHSYNLDDMRIFEPQDKNKIIIDYSLMTYALCDDVKNMTTIRHYNADHTFSLYGQQKTTLHLNLNNFLKKEQKKETLRHLIKKSLKILIFQKKQKIITQRITRSLILHALKEQNQLERFLSSLPFCTDISLIASARSKTSFTLNFWHRRVPYTFTLQKTKDIKRLIRNSFPKIKGNFYTTTSLDEARNGYSIFINLLNTEDNIKIAEKINFSNYHDILKNLNKNPKNQPLKLKRP